MLLASNLAFSVAILLVCLYVSDGLKIAAFPTLLLITTLVRLTERNGLVRRERDREDGRAYRIHLTPRARSFLPVAERALAGLDDRVASRLSPADRTILTESLKEVMLL